MFGFEGIILSSIRELSICSLVICSWPRSGLGRGDCIQYFSLREFWVPVSLCIKLGTSTFSTLIFLFKDAEVVLD